MANCERCGRSGMGLIHGAVKFKDRKYVCVKCLKELGYDHPVKDAYYLSLQTSEDILHPEIRRERQRQEDCRRRAERLDITPVQCDALDKAQATDFEVKVFSRLCALLEDEGCSSAALTVSSGTNGSLIVLLDGTVLLEYKGEPQVKWVRLSDDPDSKIRFGQLSKLNILADRIVALYDAG